jgi:hypothetical protein
MPLEVMSNHINIRLNNYHAGNGETSLTLEINKGTPSSLDEVTNDAVPRLVT